MRMFSRPVSSAACERVFSKLSEMDDSDRSNMNAETLKNILFLRGNSETMRSVLVDENAKRIQAEKSAAAAEKDKAAAIYKESSKSKIAIPSVVINTEDSNDVVENKTITTGTFRLMPGKKRLMQEGGGNKDSSNEEDRGQSKGERTKKSKL